MSGYVGTRRDAQLLRGGFQSGLQIDVELLSSCNKIWVGKLAKGGHRSIVFKRDPITVLAQQHPNWRVETCGNPVSRHLRRSERIADVVLYRPTLKTGDLKQNAMIPEAENGKRREGLQFAKGTRGFAIAKQGKYPVIDPQDRALEL